MRLTCPNCDAQYEVPDDVVPPEGRDVQCSNCGQTWFQHHPDNAPEAEDVSLDAPEPAADEELSPPEPEAAPEDETASDTGHRDEPEPETETDPDDAAAVEDDQDDAEHEEASAPPDAPQRRELDPAVADILRQEAEAEQELRRKHSSEPLESQPDLGLDGADEPDEGDARRTQEARERMARMRGEPTPMSEAAVNAAAISSRRDLLPDIEEINSTLRNEGERNAADGQADIEGPTAQSKRRSFRTGFLLMLLIFVILALIYLYAPQIAQRVPAMDPLLSSYVGWVDGLRLWLDGYVQGALRGLDNMASRSEG